MTSCTSSSSASTWTDLTPSRARTCSCTCTSTLRSRCAPPKLLARALTLALTLTLTLTPTLTVTRCADDCSFSAEQLEALLSATFASAELDSDGRIRRHSFAKLLSARPGLTAALRQRLSINVNQTIANLIMGLDERWLEVGDR